MGSRSRNKQGRAPWCVQQPLTPLVEGPDPDTQDDAVKKESSSSSSWEVIREWLGMHHKDNKSSPSPVNMNHQGLLLPPNSSNMSSSPYYASLPPRTHDLRLLLGVLGCPLAPIPLPLNHHHLRLTSKDTSSENSVAHYIIQQYLAATGILSKQETKAHKNMYATGDLKMVRCETEVSSGKAVKSLGGRSSTDTGCFVIWQMSPGMWSLELVVSGNKVVAGSDGNTVWRHTPWMGTHAAKGPHRPLRRIIQGLDPRSTATLFGKAQCLGEKRIGETDCFVLKVAADREAVMERSEGAAEVLRHVLYGYFCQKSGLLVYLEDSHLTRVLALDDDDEDPVYWETTIGSSISDYRDVDGVLLAHQGRSVATVFRFQEDSLQHSRTRMEEHWRIDDVVFNVQGLSSDHFIPPADIVAS